MLVTKFFVALYPIVLRVEMTYSLCVYIDSMSQSFISGWEYVKLGWILGRVVVAKTCPIQDFEG